MYPVLVISMLLFGIRISAAEPATGPQSAPSPAVPTESALKQKLPLKKSKGKKTREKEATEGTEALDRFEANTIIKSRYTLDGQSLEVDPD